jgi:hypothetical protein
VTFVSDTEQKRGRRRSAMVWFTGVLDMRLGISLGGLILLVIIIWLLFGRG